MKNRYPAHAKTGDNSPGDTLIKDLTTGSVSRKLMVFSVPFMLANLLQVSYNLVDMMVVGRFVDSAGISAVSNGGEIMHLTIALCLGLSSAGQILIAQLVGRKDSAGLKKTIGTIFSFLGIFSIALTVLGLVMIDWIILVMNIPIEACAGTREYCVVFFLGLLFVFGYNAVSAMLRGMGDSKRPFMIIAAATMLNLILDLIFVRTMGVRGAAIATVIAQGTSCIGSVFYLYVKRAAFGFDFKPGSFVIDGAILKSLLKLGLPLALQFSAVILSKLCVNAWINSYGVTISAVTGIGTKIGLVASIVTTALGTASASMIGQSFGAGKLDRINQIIYVSLAWGLIFTVPLSVLIILFPEQAFSLFTTDPDVLAMSNNYVIIAVMNFNGFALRTPMMALINGLGHGKLAIVIGILDGVVARIGLAMLMGLSMGMGIMGFWYGNVFAGYVPFLIGGVYFVSGMWKQRKLAIEVC